MNLPNKLTLLRFILVPIIVIIYYLNKYLNPYTYLIIGILFILGSITDFLDGYIARKNNLVTSFGKFMDPIADKILVIATLLLLTVEIRELGVWIIIVVVVRELMVSGIRLLASLEGGEVVPAKMLGKIKTTTQMVGISIALIYMFLGIYGLNIDNLFIDILKYTSIVFIYISVAFTIISGLEVLWNNRKYIKQTK